jgi:outer membrane murein-binding lipoprotein Lpp
MNRSQRLTILAVSLAATMLSGCTRSADLNIVNNSTAELTNVSATGSGSQQASSAAFP